MGLNFDHHFKLTIEEDASKEDIENEIEYWEEQYGYACEISDSVGRKEILTILNDLNERN